MGEAFPGDQRAVRPFGDRSGGEGRDLGKICDLRECGHMRAKCRKIDVPNQLKQPALMVNQQHDGIAGIDQPDV